MIALWLGLPLASASPPQMDSIYLVMVDRFSNGSGSNDGLIDPNKPQAFHGGDLIGLTQKLDAIEQIGVDTIWLTPITKMRTEPIVEHGAYHGYWVSNGRKLEPRFGTYSDLNVFRDALEQRGIKLLLDIVLNHVGPDTPLTQTHPDWFRKNGDITDWADPVQRRTHDVHGLPDLDQERVDVTRHLVEDGLYWLKTARPSGFRIDAVRHMDPTFLKVWVKQMNTNTETPLIFAGEIFDGNPVAVAKEVQASGLTHSFDFPLYYALIESICEGKDLRKIAAVLTQDRHYPAHHQWITFLDNHDTPRVATSCGDKTKTAFTLLTSMRGIPSITWGTEVGLTGKTESEARSDMRFEDHPMVPFLARLLDDRRAYSPLTDGKTDILKATDTELVLARVMPSEAVIISIGGSGQPVLPKEADAAHWINIESEGMQRWLITPKEGNGFQAWFERIQADESSTSDISINMAGTDYLSGSDVALGAWDPQSAVGPGQVTVALPRGGVVAVKRLKRTGEGTVVWSAHPDHFIDVDAATILDEPVKLGR